MERKRWECPALPQGWEREEVPRRSGLSAGHRDVFYYSPSGKKFRSKPQLARYLGGSMDLSTFDFRTGKMLMSKINKSRQRVRYDSSSQAKGKPDLNTALPVRQTASIFKQPVTKITNHPSNKVKSDPQKAVEQPRQLFWEKKLSGLNAFDIAEELVKTMDLPKGLQGVGPGCTDETLLSAIASALHTSSMPITGQLSAAVEKNPGVWLNTAQPLCKAFMVTDEDIRKQEELVQQVRKRLEEALMADMLAHVEELARDGGAPLGEAGVDDDEDEDDEEEEGPDQDPDLEHVVWSGSAGRSGGHHPMPDSGTPASQPTPHGRCPEHLTRDCCHCAATEVVLRHVLGQCVSTPAGAGRCPCPLARRCCNCSEHPEQTARPRRLLP
ncbi:methyl-CpG-binding domain protein 3 isoform X2 [Manis pentadactyla]|uniref:methyl-CpG-binding domain protein 3 isoform X2 n=1 Tax=Manis pentadactyla TaxID=143292 RepID=UPI00255C5792|nr:methyl-CpG-binding domain protein 3 isoform X2 [Manis pentadactyla]